MTDREKLIQIMENAGSLRQYPGSMASILIENGVTFATNNNVGSKWIPVTERLPEADKMVLCLEKSGDCWLAMWNHCDDQMWSDGDYWYSKNGVTHWMPLPEPPKGE